MEKLIINPAALYENDHFALGCFEDKDLHNMQRRLRRAGFKLSACKKAYFHPKHWRNKAFGFGKKDPGDTWIYEDAFKALTPEAKATLEDE